MVDVGWMTCSVHTKRIQPPPLPAVPPPPPAIQTKNFIRSRAEKPNIRKRCRSEHGKREYNKNNNTKKRRREKPVTTATCTRAFIAPISMLISARTENADFLTEKGNY